MRLLAARVTQFVPDDYIQYVGDFISPRAFQLVGKTPVWAADNDAYSGFNETRYLKMLDRIAEAVEAGTKPPMFVTVPDVVGDHFATEKLWHKWAKEVRDRGLPAAFVLQNGVGYHWAYWMAGHAPDFPWDDVDAFYIGGTTEFKFSEEVREIVDSARYHGKWIHMGRVNSIKRMLYARAIGCDSCDGSGMARFPSTQLIPMVRALHVETMMMKKKRMHLGYETVREEA